MVMDPAFFDDPVELRIRLDLALEHAALLEERIAALEAEIAELKASAGAPAARVSTTASPSVRPGPVPGPAPVSAGDGLPFADHSSAPEVKIALFRALFVGREDVYARRQGRDVLKTPKILLFAGKAELDLDFQSFLASPGAMLRRPEPSGRSARGLPTAYRLALLLSNHVSVARPVSPAARRRENEVRPAAGPA